MQYKNLNEDEWGTGGSDYIIDHSKYKVKVKDHQKVNVMHTQTRILHAYKHSKQMWDHLICPVHAAVPD